MQQVTAENLDIHYHELLRTHRVAILLGFLSCTSLKVAAIEVLRLQQFSMGFFYQIWQFVLNTLHI